MIAIAYSKSGIIEYWILDVNGCKLYIYRLPSPDGYHSERRLAEDLTISPLAFGDCATPNSPFVPTNVV
nr:Uma2 family endonuclease [aff. Roholtiella sp. LEGE 12411]